MINILHIIKSHNLHCLHTLSELQKLTRRVLLSRVKIMAGINMAELPKNRQIKPAIIKRTKVYTVKIK